LRLVAQREEDFRGEEDRRDEDLEQVVGERRLAALEHVADQLQDPAADEQHREPDPTLHRAQVGDVLPEENQRRGDREHGQRQRHVEEEVIEHHRAGEHHGRRDRQAAGVEADPRERNEQRQDDRGHADEVRGLVARVLVVRGIEAHLLFDRFHGETRINTL